MEYSPRGRNSNCSNFTKKIFFQHFTYYYVSKHEILYFLLLRLNSMHFIYRFQSHIYFFPYNSANSRFDHRFLNLSFFLFFFLFLFCPCLLSFISQIYLILQNRKKELEEEKR